MEVSAMGRTAPKISNGRCFSGIQGQNRPRIDIGSLSVRCFQRPACSSLRRLTASAHPRLGRNYLLFTIVPLGTVGELVQHRADGQDKVSEIR